jgi:hypothetical protein
MAGVAPAVLLTAHLPPGEKLHTLLGKRLLGTREDDMCLAC